MVNSYPIALSVMVKSHPIALSYGELSPHGSFLWWTLTPSLFLMVNFYPIVFFLMVNFHPIAPFYGELSPHPRWLSLLGLTLLLTVSEMDPACEASVINLSWCCWSCRRHWTETVQCWWAVSWHGIGQYPVAQQQCFCLPCEPPRTFPCWDFWGCLIVPLWCNFSVAWPPGHW